RERGMISSLITNGYYISRERIRRLNEAGLDYLQISIDNVEPDEVSLKSLRLLEPKLQWLADHAQFGVNINSVVGAGIKNPEDALAVARRARALGFTSTVGILHDGRGQLEPLGERELEVYQALKKFGSRGDARFNGVFQDNLARGRANEWSCRAGARYLYVDEHGIVHYCSQMRGVRGERLVLVGRRTDRLARLSAELGGADIALPLTLDLARPESAESLQRMLESRGIGVSLLVNNAGVGYAGRMHEQSPEKLRAML